VWVTEEEIRRIAEFREQSIGEIRLFHTRLVGRDVSLTEFPNGDCTFFDPATRRCTIYPVRPTQCRTWPFWNSNLRTREAWDRVAQTCPGVGRGPLVPLEVIQAQAAEVQL
jgi:Fe-S-cluster containining protein